MGGVMNPPLVIIILIVVAVLVLIPIAYFVGYHVAEKREKRSRQIFEARSKAVNKGLIAEHLAPLLPDFPPDLKPSEMRFIGKPVDFLVFKGMDEQKITELVFLEVKTGTSTLNKNEYQVRKAIERKKVSWREYRPNLQSVSKPIHNAERVAAESTRIEAEAARVEAETQAAAQAQAAAAEAAAAEAEKIRKAAPKPQLRATVAAPQAADAGYPWRKGAEVGYDPDGRRLIRDGVNWRYDPTDEVILEEWRVAAYDREGHETAIYREDEEANEEEYEDEDERD
jgi:hypothetical protein